jgi:hypothetical protein
MFGLRRSIAMTLILPTIHLLARPEVRPSVLTLARDTAATRINALGRVETVPADGLRHDYDPAGGGYRGWLVEEARTNLVLHSQDLAQAPWLTEETTVAAGTVTGPDGATPATALTETTATAIHALFQDDVSFVAGQTYSLSVFARANGRERLQLTFVSMAFGVVPSAVFDLTGGSIGATEDGAEAAIEALADGWYRCAITATATVTTLAPVHLRLRDTTSESTYAGDGTSGVLLFGAQVEAGGGPTSYIPTTTTTVARAADRLSVDLTARVFNPLEGALLVRGTVAPGTAATLADLSDGSGDARMSLSFDAGAGTAAFTVVDGGTTQASLTRSGLSGGTEARAAAAYDADDFALTLDAAALATDGAGTVPGVTTLTLGGTGTGGAGPRCWVRQVGLFPRRLADADLQSIAT